MTTRSLGFDRDSTPNETAWSITGRIIAGMAVYGGLGWLLSLWLGHASLMVAAGILVGLAAGTYLVHVHLRNEEAEVEQSESVKAWNARVKR